MLIKIYETNTYVFIGLFMGRVMLTQIWQRTIAKRKVTLTTCMCVSAASSAHSQGEKCFPEEKTVSCATGVLLYLMYSIHNDRVYPSVLELELE
jgi:hypothetical protein